MTLRDNYGRNYGYPLRFPRAKETQTFSVYLSLVESNFLENIILYERSMQALWDVFKIGYIGKDDLAATLRSHQAALDAMKSPQRDAAEAAL